MLIYIITYNTNTTINSDYRNISINGILPIIYTITIIPYLHIIYGNTMPTNSFFH